MMERPDVEGGQPRLRNAPIRPRAWRDLMESDDVAAIESDAGTLLLTLASGQVNLHYAFVDQERMTHEFVPLFGELEPEIDSFDAAYVRIDLVQVPDRAWVEPLLHEVDFRHFGEWMDMVHYELDADAPPPEFPRDVTMRRADAGDFDRIVAIESQAYGDLADGETATRLRLEDAAWVGVLEQEGEIVAYAVNGEVDAARGQILSAAVAPEARGHGFGQLVLAAAVYQLTAADAREATVRVRPAIGQALRITQALGFRPGDRGVEWRRPSDAETIAERRHSERRGGIKARFGNWR